MGYIRHHAILVTATYDDWAAKAHAEACRVFIPQDYESAPPVSPLTASGTNGAQSFAVFPDGSKEGWAMSDYGDELRERFIAWLRAQAYEDGSSPLAWVEVQYGDDNRETAVCRHSDEGRATT